MKLKNERLPQTVLVTLQQKHFSTANYFPDYGI
jgi:hypothetical protein